ncbi:Initiation factor 2B-related protein [Dioscorea alata]|uniref:Initiation factor 2B-related protein n=1 Tax=Dioscorea alata TaxID=55571 RepID=A0ACB7VML4_DIOAL|nr:Initiation factor 2B-related protein [Dioscorea alata]
MFVLLACGLSSAGEILLLYAHEANKQFHLVVVDSRLRLEGQVLLHRLVSRGLNCTYAHINAISTSCMKLHEFF